MPSDTVHSTFTPGAAQHAVWALWAWLWQLVPYAGIPWVAAIGRALLLAGSAAIVSRIAVPRIREWWLDETPRPGEDESGVSTEELSLLQHLLELRRRLIVTCIALAATTAFAAVFYRLWLEIAIWPIGGHPLQAITPTEMIFAYFKLVVGLILSMPVIAYQVWAFVAPGLTRKERRYALSFIPGATIMFALGVVFSYFTLIPASLGFLLGVGDGGVTILPTIQSYITFVTKLLIACGLVFQLPLAWFFLAKLRIVSPQVLGGIRRYVIVGAFVVAALATPPEPFSQLLMAVPILILYEVGVLFARWA